MKKYHRLGLILFLFGIGCGGGGGGKGADGAPAGDTLAHSDGASPPDGRRDAARTDASPARDLAADAGNVSVADGPAAAIDGPRSADAGSGTTGDAPASAGDAPLAADDAPRGPDTPADDGALAPTFDLAAERRDAAEPTADASGDAPMMADLAPDLPAKHDLALLDVGPPQQTTIGPAGGTLTLDGVTVTFPPGALAADTAVTLAQSTSPVPSGYQGQGGVYTLSAQGNPTLLLPISVSMTLAGGVSMTTIFFAAPGGVFAPLQASVAGATATAPLSTFGSFFAGNGANYTPPPDRSCALLTRLGLQPAMTSGIVLPFTVEDCQGWPWRGLSRADFAIRESGQTISSESTAVLVERGARPVFVTLLLDGSASTQSSWPDVIAAARAFVEELHVTRGLNLHIDLRVFDGEVGFAVGIPSTLDTARLLAAMTDLASFVPRKSGTNLYASVVNALKTQAEARAAYVTRTGGFDTSKGFIVLFTDGRDTTGHGTLAQVGTAKETYPDTLIGIGLASADYDSGILRNIVTRAGQPVLLHEPPSSATLLRDFGTVANRVAAHASGYYVLGYCTTTANGSRTLDVTLTALATNTVSRTFTADGHTCDASYFTSACDSYDCAGFGCGRCNDRTDRCSSAGTAGRCVSYCDHHDSLTCGGLTITNPEGFQQVCDDRIHASACLGANGCLDLRADPSNCGACGNTCPASTTCINGSCTCADGQTSCFGGCTSLATSVNNCGACGNVCPSAATCNGEACVCAKDMIRCGEGCVDPKVNTHACGGCGVIAPACSAGVPHKIVALAGSSTDFPHSDVLCQLLDNGAVQCSTKPHEGGGSIMEDVPGLDGVTAIAGSFDNGSYHMCAIVAAGQVRCWGLNSDGQLGNGATSTALVTTPVTVTTATGPLANVTKTAAGIRFSCALSAGQVYCWGKSDKGQLGQGDKLSHATAMLVPGVTGATDLVAGSAHACALGTGRMQCWGYGLPSGLAGGASLALLPNTVLLDGVEAWASRIFAGASSTCAIATSDNKLRCWGADIIETTPSQPSLPSVEPPSNITAMLPGATMCAVSAGRVYCWGGSNRGTGQPDREIYELVTQVPLITDAVSFMSNGYCVVLGSGEVRCWNTASLSTESLSAPTQANLENVALMAGGTDMTCAVLSSGAVKCWGTRGAGQGFWSVTGVSAPTAIASGQRAACALSGGKSYCWGADTSAMLSVSGSLTHDTTQVMRMADDSEAANISAIAVGGYNACVVIAGAVYCAGQNGNEQIVQGNGAATSYPRLTQVAGVSNAVQVDVGSNFICARLGTGRVACWGENAQRQAGPAAARAVQEIPGMTDAVDIATGNAHACAVSAAGTITCWGANEAGQLGNGSIKAGLQPSQVVGIDTAVAVRAGGNFTCALLADRSVQCWGGGQYYQLGIFDSYSHSAQVYARDHWLPATVPFLGPVVDLMAGATHACAADTSGNAFCWGDNRYGQRGRGGVTKTPVAPLTW